MKNCEKCKNPQCSAHGKDVELDCNLFMQVCTNADRIRAMTDEELVKHLACQWAECKNMDVECDKCLLDWLKQEAN